MAASRLRAWGETRPHSLWPAACRVRLPTCCAASSITGRSVARHRGRGRDRRPRAPARLADPKARTRGRRGVRRRGCLADAGRRRRAVRAAARVHRRDRLPELPRHAERRERRGGCPGGDRARRNRLEDAGGGLPWVIGALLVVGSIVIVGYTVLVGSRSFWFRAIGAGAIALVLGSSLVVLLDLTYPFSGDLSVDPGPFGTGGLAQFFAPSR
jgi:hypothetical protein